MAKIINQSGLTANNLIFHIVELDQRSTISVTASTSTIADSAAEFVSAGFAVGDRIYIRFASASNPNNGYATIATITAGAITVTGHTGTLTDQAAGSLCSIQRLKKTFEFVAVDGLDLVDGVSNLALASELQTRWDTGNFDKYDFPYTELRPDAEALTFVDGWEPHNLATVNAIRDGAIIIRNGETGALTREYMNVNSANFLNFTGQAYYWQEPDGDITDFVTQGYVNQLILIQDVPNGVDFRNYFVAKLAEPGRTVVYYNLTLEQEDIEILTAKKYGLILRDQLDLVLADASGNVRVDDNTIATQAPYTSITYTLFATPQSRSIEGTPYNFDAIVSRTGATKEQVHTKLNWLIRQKALDIDSGSGTLLGGHSPAISTFLGSEITFQGFADGTPANERNDTIFIDNTGVGRRFDRTAAFAIDFIVEPMLTTTAKFNVYLASVFNTDGSTPLLDGDGNAATGTLTTDETRSYTIRYSTFNQFGHTPGTPIPIVVTLSAPGELRPATYDFTINDNTTQVFQVRGVETTAYRAAV